MKLRFLPVAAAVAALVSLKLTTVQGADAHTAEVTASCQQGLQVHLRYYDKDTKLTIVVDGDEANAVRITFTGDYDYVYSLQVPATAHRYVVTIDNAGTRWDATYTGEVDCSPPFTTTTTAPPTTTTGFPATPPCPFPGKGIYDWNDAECVESPKTDIGAPVVEESKVATPTHLIPAFTG